MSSRRLSSRPQKLTLKRTRWYRDAYVGNQQWFLATLIDVLGQAERVANRVAAPFGRSR